MTIKVTELKIQKHFNLLNTHWQIRMDLNGFCTPILVWCIFDHSIEEADLTEEHGDEEGGPWGVGGGGEEEGHPRGHREHRGG